MVALVDGLLDAMAAKGSADLIADLAAAVPVEVIGNLLAVPRDERGPLRDWSLAILGALEPVIDARSSASAASGRSREFVDYLRLLVADRRAHPGDPSRDVLTRLIQGEADGERLSERELLHNIIFILNAGHETTTNLIGNGLVVLLEWPEEKARLIAKPELIRPAVEEFLRFESSNQLGNRVTTRPVEIGGVAMPAGTFITIGIGAANRDPAEFPDPDRLDVAREPNRHLAFGSGAHVCAGLNVARLEGRIAIGRFLARFPNYRLSAATPCAAAGPASAASCRSPSRSAEAGLCVRAQRLVLAGAPAAQARDVRQKRVDLVRLESELGHGRMSGDDAFSQGLGQALYRIALMQDAKRRRGLQRALAGRAGSMAARTVLLGDGFAALQRRAAGAGRRGGGAKQQAQARRAI